MAGSFITGALMLILGYAYPAYECYKTVELNRPEIEKLRFWCQYWILLAVLTVFDRVGDNFVSWLPMYGEAKLAFVVYLWYPKTLGTAYVYESFFKPCIAKYEAEIDHNLLDLRTRAGDMAVLYFQKVANYGQTRFYEILQYVASQLQSQTSRQQQARQQQQRPPPPPPPTRQVNPPKPVPAPSVPPLQPQPTQAPPTAPRNQTQDTTPIPVAPPGAVSPAQPQTQSGLPQGIITDGPQNAEAMQVDPPAPPTSNRHQSSIPDEDTLIQEAIQMTQG